MKTDPHSLLLTGARVYRHDGDVDMPAKANVLIRDGVIVAVDEPGARAPSEAAQTLDLSGHLLMPGFVNSHYHSHDVLAKGFFEAIPLEQWGLIAGPIANNRDMAELRLRTLVGAVEALRNGVTTVQDFSSFAPMRSEVVDSILDAYEEAGLRVVYSVTVRDRSQLDTILDAREVVPAELRSIVGESADDPDAQLAFVENEINRVGDRDGKVIWALSPSAPQRCTPPLLAGMARLATARDLPVYTHVYESRGQRIFAMREYEKHGGSAIRYMAAQGLVGPRVTIAHGVWPDPGEIEFFAGTGSGVVLNMLSNLKLRNGVAPIGAYRRLGVPLALGSDNCSCSDTHAMFQVMKMYCLLGGISDPECAAPSAAEAIRLATSGGAERAGQQGRLGAIEPGHRADLVAYDLSDPAFRPLHSVARQIVFAETGRSVRHVWVGGRQVVGDGRCSSVDESKLMDELATIMPTVAARLSKLRDDADKVADIFADLQRRAWSRPLTYNRFLERS